MVSNVLEAERRMDENEKFFFVLGFVLQICAEKDSQSGTKDPILPFPNKPVLEQFMRSTYCRNYNKVDLSESETIYLWALTQFPCSSGSRLLLPLIPWQALAQATAGDSYYIHSNVYNYKNYETSTQQYTSSVIWFWTEQKRIFCRSVVHLSFWQNDVMRVS